MRILVCGPTQCGSTRLFNLVRILFEIQGKKVHSQFTLHPQPNDCGVLVEKCHGSRDLLRNCATNETLSHGTNQLIRKINDYDIILLQIRDLRDALISLIKRHGEKRNNFTILLCNIYHNMYLFNQWKKHATKIIRYEDYGIEQIRNICEILKIEMSDEQIMLAMKELSDLHHSDKLPKYDDFTNPLYQKTLMCKNHNTSNGKSEKYIDYFTKEENARILGNQEIRKFLEKYNYL